MKHASLTLKYLSTLAIVAAMGSSTSYAMFVGRTATAPLTQLVARNAARMVVHRQLHAKTNGATTTTQVATKPDSLLCQQQEIENLKRLIEEQNRRMENIERRTNSTNNIPNISEIFFNLAVGSGGLIIFGFACYEFYKIL